MKRASATAKDVDSYIAGFDPAVQKILKKVRATLRKAAPQAEEKISYRIPTFVQGRPLLYFAAFKAHIGVYPRTKGMESLERELAPYAASKGTLRFPLDQPIPVELLARLMQIRLRENQEAAQKPRRRRAAAAR